MMKYHNITVLFFLGASLVFSQKKVDSKVLLKRIDEVFEMLDQDPEKALHEAQRIEEEAQKIQAPNAELPAIAIQCIYYRGKFDFEKMMAEAKLLSRKAKRYKSDAYQVIARRYLFQAYFFSGWPEKAYEELEQGRELADRLNGEDSLDIVSKGDLYISFSNYYAVQGDYATQLKFLNLAGEEFKQMPNRKYRKKLLYIHYSNLAAAHNELNELDSAKYYIKLSHSLHGNFVQGSANITNLWVMGSVAMKEKDYETAINYFLQAEKKEGIKNHLNIESLYDNIILSYKELNKPDSAKIYALRKDSLKLSVAESQNKSLHSLLKEKEDNPYPYLYVLILFFILMTVVISLILRKNKILARQERDSQKYLESVPEGRTRQNYTQLLQMLEQGNPAFMNYFDEMFPNFSKRLMEINPQIIQSEIEFCSLLKLKIPTKDIARYKFITPKTVQNKKYLIRKKLVIPKGVDIYQWFDSL